MRKGDAVKVRYYDGSFWGFATITGLRTDDLSVSPNHAKVRFENGECHQVHMKQIEASIAGLTGKQCGTTDAAATLAVSIMSLNGMAATRATFDAGDSFSLADFTACIARMIDDVVKHEATLKEEYKAEMIRLNNQRLNALKLLHGEP